MGPELGHIFLIIWTALVTHNIEANTIYKKCYDNQGHFIKSEQLRCDKTQGDKNASEEN